MEKGSRRMGSFAHAFDCCDIQDAFEQDDEYAGGDNVDYVSVDESGDDGLWSIIHESSKLSEREAWAMNRTQLITNSQWDLVMESCRKNITGLQINNMAGTSSSADKVKKLMEWRRERGDFETRDAAEAEAELAIIRSDAEVQQLCDDMDEWNEAALALGFVKTDLQVECLLRGIAYNATDSKQTLVSKLMDLKESSPLARNSLEVLAEESSK